MKRQIGRIIRLYNVGVFYTPDEDGVEQANIILLNAFRDRWSFYAKREAVEEYDEWQPDTLIVEKKASGAPLIYEMRAMGIQCRSLPDQRQRQDYAIKRGI